MKWLPDKNVALKSITMDVADIRQRMEQPHVVDLAANIREHGNEPIHRPTLRVKDGKQFLLIGRDRIAALMLMRVKNLVLRRAECTDEEAADLEASENLHRRQDDRDEVIARAVRAKEALLTAGIGLNGSMKRGASGDPETPGGKKAIKAEARKSVARAEGVSVNAIKHAERRAAEKAAPAPAPELPEPTLNLLGCDNDGTRGVCRAARPLQEAIDEADKHLRLALGALKRIEGTAVGQKLRAAVERTGGIVRSDRPESICPWCKGVPAEKFGPCGGCQGAGFVSAERAQQAPRECLNVEKPVIVWNGAPWPYVNAFPVWRLPTNVGARPLEKKIRVEDENGNPFAADEELADELTVARDDDELAF